MNTSLILALYGSLLSTALAGIKIIEFIKDRATLRVSVKGGWQMHPPGPPYGDKSLICIRVANISTHPVVLQSVALVSPRKSKATRKYLLSIDSFKSGHPVRLTEGDAQDFYIIEDAISDLFIKPHQYVAMTTDKAGRKYYSHSYLMRMWRLGKLCPE